MVKRSRRTSIGVLPASSSEPAQQEASLAEATRSSIHVTDSVILPFSALTDAKISPETSALPYTVFRIQPTGQQVDEAFSVRQVESPESQASSEPANSTRRSSASTEDSTSRGASGPRKLTLSRHRTVLRLELNKEVQLMKQNIVTQQPWVDALRVMKFVTINSTTSSVVAAIVAFILSLGYPFHIVRDLSPVSRRVVRDSVAVGCVLVTALGSLVIVAFVVAKSSKAARRSRSPWVPLSLRRVAVRLLHKTWQALFLTVVVTVGWMETISSLDDCIPPQGYHGQLFVIFATVYAFVLYLARAASRLYQKISTQLHTVNLAGSIVSDGSSLSSTSDTSSTDGIIDRKTSNSQLQETRKVSAMSTTESPVKSIEVAPGASWKLRRIDRIFFFAVFNVAFVYLYVSSYISLNNQWKVLFFASVSLVIKITLQEAAKNFVLCNNANSHRQILSPIVIHAAMTIPTVVIDAQIRLVFVRFGVGQSAVGTSFSIVLCELIFRTAKIVRLRHIISSRLAQNSGIRRALKRVNSKVAAHDVAKMRAEYSQFLVWKLHVLRLHAAEVYADMHGEYISMGCAIAITVFLGGDRLAIFDLTPGTACEDNASSLCSQRHTAIDSRQFGAVVSQVVSGLVVDYFASVVEIVHEVPLLETIKGEDNRLRSFLRVLLAVLASVHVSSVALFYLKPVE